MEITRDYHPLQMASTEANYTIKITSRISKYPTFSV
jgi:hypothetical protein